MILQIFVLLFRPRLKKAFIDAYKDGYIAALGEKGNQQPTATQIHNWLTNI